MKDRNTSNNSAQDGVPAGDSPAFRHWQSVCAKLSAIGAVRRKLEGFRLHLDLKYYKLLAGTSVDDWIAWPVGSRCCRLAPRPVRHLFVRDREQAETRLGVDMGGSATGDEPVKIAVRSHGRIHLCDQLTTATGITKNGEVMVVPRRDVLEVWDLARWRDLCGRADPAGNKAATGARDAIPGESNLSRGNPICSDPQARHL